MLARTDHSARNHETVLEHRPDGWCVRSLLMISLPSPTCWTTASSPFSSASFLASKILQAVICMESMIFFSFCARQYGVCCTTQRRKPAGPSLQSTGERRRNMTIGKRVGLGIRVRTQRLVDVTSKGTYPRLFIASPKGLGVSSVRASSEYPRPPCPTSSSAVRLVHSSKSIFLDPSASS